MEEIDIKNSSPVLIVGSPRSGTTLLQLMVNAHPNIAIYGEVHYFDQIVPLKKLVFPLQTFTDIDNFFLLVNNIYNIQYLPNAKEFFEQVKEKLKDEKKPTYEKFYLYLLREYAQQERANIYGDKTPTYIRYLQDIINLFPNAKIIHIIRDPRAVVASLLKTPFASNCVVTNALKWRIDIQSSFGTVRDSNSYLELRYEDLILKPEIRLKKICHFIGEIYDSNMLNFYKNSKEYIKDEPWKDNVHYPVSNTSINKWEKDLSQTQIFIIEKIIGSNLLSKFGYTPAKIRISAVLMSPFVFLWELLKYMRWKFNEKKSLHENSTLIYGNNRKIYSLIFNILFDSK